MLRFPIARSAIAPPLHATARSMSFASVRTLPTRLPLLLPLQRQIAFASLISRQVPPSLHFLLLRSYHTSPVSLRFLRPRRPQPIPRRTEDADKASLPPTSPTGPISESPLYDPDLAKQEAEVLRQRIAFWSRQHIRPPSALGALAYLLAFGIASFGTAAYLSLRETSQLAEEVRASRGPLSNFTSFFTASDGGTAEQDVWGSGVDERTLTVASKHQRAERLGRGLKRLTGWCDQLGLPDGVKQVLGRSYVMVSEQYLNLPASKEVLVPILALNTVVFALWRLAPLRPQLQHFMSRHFLHRPSSGRLYTTLTSTFSHRGGLHFLLNNFALWSFGGGAVIYASHINAGAPIIAEASQTPHFLAFFATAGVFAAVVSHVASAVRFRRIATVKGLEAAKMSVGRQSSLGASGAVYAAVVASACAFPDARISLIFLPFFSFPIGWGVSGMVAADMLGAISGWTMFDHFAHLGGALFGYIYFYYGPFLWTRCKGWVLPTFGEKRKGVYVVSPLE